MRIGEMYGTDAPSLATDGRNQVHLVWTARLGQKEHDIHYVRLDDQGMVEQHHELNAGLLHPRRPRLLLDEDGTIHVFVLAMSEPGAPSGLFHLSLTGDGGLESRPTLLSSPDRPVYSYDVVAGPWGPTHMFWTEEADAGSGIFHSTLGSEEQPKLILHGASHPAVATDSSGNLHLLWSQHGRTSEDIEFYYGALGSSVPERVSGIKLVALDRGKFLDITWPVLALDRGHAYAIWVVEPAQTYGEAFRQVWYVSIGLDEGQPGSLATFVLPVDEYPVYVSHEAPYAYGHIVLLPSPPEFGTMNYMIDTPSTLPAQAEQALVAFSALVQRGAGMEAQVLVGIFAEGRLVGYQQACKTTHWSRVPGLISDSDSNLHLSWVEGLEPGPSDVYYSSTSPLVKERVDHLTSEDLVLGLLNTLFGAAAGFALMPFVVVWLIGPLVWVGISGLFIGEEGVQGPKGRVALAISLLVYLIIKAYLTPSLFTYVPFSASMPFLPSSLEIPLRVFVPVVIVTAGAGAVMYTLRRVKTRSLLLSSLAFMLLDALLTVGIYGPGILALR